MMIMITIIQMMTTVKMMMTIEMMIAMVEMTMTRTIKAMIMVAVTKKVQICNKLNQDTTSDIIPFNNCCLLSPIERSVVRKLMCKDTKKMYLCQKN